MIVPSRLRYLSDSEWEIVSRVFQDTLPWRRRIFLTNGLGAGNAPFRIPTCAIHPLTIPAILSTAIHGLAAGAMDEAGQALSALLSGSSVAAKVVQRLSPVLAAGAAAASPAVSVAGTVFNVTGSMPTMVLEGPARLNSVVNFGYVMNVGPKGYPDMTKNKNLLVHEMTHVWQGYNAVFAMTYVLNSAYHQCKGMVRGGYDNRDAAYGYRPGQWFKTYNAEQQASIVEDWFAAGEPQTGALWPYIRDHVRAGAA